MTDINGGKGIPTKYYKCYGKIVEICEDHIFVRNIKEKIVKMLIQGIFRIMTQFTRNLSFDI